LILLNAKLTPALFPPRPPVKAIRFSIGDFVPVAFSFPGASRRGFAGRRGATTSASGLLGLVPSHFVRPRFGFAASARPWMTSAAVCPCAAQCILFCTMAKKSCDASTR
jgi:hypothetical protein